VKKNKGKKELVLKKKLADKADASAPKHSTA
jgi:hypothetical protein